MRKLIGAMVLAVVGFAAPALAQGPVGPTPPAAMTVEAASAATGNLNRWRDAERTRLGPPVEMRAVDSQDYIAYMQEHARQTAACRAARARNTSCEVTVQEPQPTPGKGEIEAVRGVFLVGPGAPEDFPFPVGTLVEGGWSDSYSETGAATEVVARVVGDLTHLDRCDVGFYISNGAMDGQYLAYLGPVMTQSFETIATAVRAARGAPETDITLAIAKPRPADAALAADIFPDDAKGIRGAAQLRCRIEAAGAGRCVVKSETPPGRGLGAGARSYMARAKYSTFDAVGRPLHGACFNATVTSDGASFSITPEG